MTDILIYAEDPGAGNFLSGLADACRSLGLSCSLIGEAGAAELFRNRGEVFERSGGSAQKLLAKHSPRLVVAGTAEDRDSIGLSLISQARSRGTITVGAVDAAMNADSRFSGRSGDPLGHAPDWIIASDDETRDRFATLGYSVNRIMVHGHPTYDYVWSIRDDLEGQSRNELRKRLFKGVAPDRKVVIFAAEISDGLNPEHFLRAPDYTLAGRNGSDKRTDIVFEEFLDALPTGEERPYVVLRMHPKNTIEEFSAYLDEVDMVSSAESAHEVVWGADLLVGMTTILLVEGAILGCPTFSIVPRESEGRDVSTVRAGITSCAWLREDVRTELVRLLSADGVSPVLPTWLRVRNVRQGIAKALAALITAERQAF